MRRIVLAILCILAAAGIAKAQIWNLSQYAAPSSPPHQAVFDNGGNPWPAFNQINAFNYDLGGQGIAYSATQGACIASGAAAYRSAGGGNGDAINPKVSADSGTQFLIGCTAVNNFFRYTAAFSQSGPYAATMRLASGASSSATWTVSIDGVAVTTVNSPPTGSYTTFATQTSGSFNVTFPANHIVTVTCSVVNSDTGCGDFNWIQFGQVGSIPTPAVAAGFNTLAFQADFTTAFYATKSNWLDCAGASSPQWYRGWRGVQAGADCSHFTQATDPLTGTLALKTTWSATDYTPSPQSYGTFLETMDPNTGVGTNFNFMYAEVIGRSDRVSPTHISDFWSVSATNGGLEFDGIEWWNGTNDSDGGCVHNDVVGFIPCAWFTGPPTANPSIDFTAYHKYAWRVTSDGTTDSYMCAYIDDVLQPNCQTWRANANQLVANGAGFPLGINLFNSMACRGISIPCDTGTGTFNMYVKSVKVWACSGWNAGSKCLSSTPNP